MTKNNSGDPPEATVFFRIEKYGQMRSVRNF